MGWVSGTAKAAICSSPPATIAASEPFRRLRRVRLNSGFNTTGNLPGKTSTVRHKPDDGITFLWLCVRRGAFLTTIRLHSALHYVLRCRSDSSPQALSTYARGSVGPHYYHPDARVYRDRSSPP